MEKHEIMALIDTKLHEVFKELQDSEGVTEGDIDPMDALELDKLTEQATELVHKVIAYQKGWK